MTQLYIYIYPFFFKLCFHLGCYIILNTVQVPCGRSLLVQCNCSVMSDSLRPHGLQHARLRCPSSTPRACSNLSPLSPWFHPPFHLLSPLLLLPSIFPSIRVFSKESVLPIRWPKYLSFSFNIGPSNEHSGLISSRIDWLDVLAVQGTLKSLLQYHSSKTSNLGYSF